MKTLSRAETADFLLQADHFAILTHSHPDGDTLGSAAALCRMLRRLGKTAHVLENSQITSRYTWLLDGLTKEKAGEGDTIVCVDVAADHLLPEEFRCYLGRIHLRIDHHGGRDCFTQRELVEPDAGACTEILYELSLKMGLPLDTATAEALYVGTATDTACFRLSNTTSHTFTVAAACAAAGARIYELNQELFETNSLQRLKIQSWIVDHMRIFGDGQLALVAIPAAVEREIGVTEDDMNNVLTFLRTVTQVEMASTLLENEDGTSRLSIRSQPGVDASVVAAALGGGGHREAAGATVKLPLEEAAIAVEEEMLRYRLTIGKEGQPAGNGG